MDIKWFLVVCIHSNFILLGWLTLPKNMPTSLVVLGSPLVCLYDMGLLVCEQPDTVLTINVAHVVVRMLWGQYFKCDGVSFIMKIMVKQNVQISLIFFFFFFIM